MTERQIADILRHNAKALEIVRAFKAKYEGVHDTFKKLTDNDALAVLLLSPTVGVALFNEEINFYEGVYLKIKARKLSAGGVLHFSDPVVEVVKVLYKNFSEWELDFYQYLKQFINSLKHKEDIDIMDAMVSVANIQKDGRYATKTMDQKAFEKIVWICYRLEYTETHAFKQFREDYKF